MVADRAVDEGDDEDMAPHRRNRLTCACFDVGGRRLMTGSSDGNVRLWNFANGVMLKEMTTPQVDDVTSLVHAVNESGDSKRVVSTGWNGLVTVWEDLGGIASRSTTPGRSPAVTSTDTSSCGTWTTAASDTSSSRR